MILGTIMVSKTYASVANSTEKIFYYYYILLYFQYNPRFFSIFYWPFYKFRIIEYFKVVFMLFFYDYYFIIVRSIW